MVVSIAQFLQLVASTSHLERIQPCSAVGCIAGYGASLAKIFEGNVFGPRANVRCHVRENAYETWT
jgi:hypothetical protein